MAKRNLFSFDAETETPETLAERRARAAAVAGQIGNATTIGGGIGDILRGLGAGLSRYRTDSAQREGEASGRSAMDGFLDILDQPQAQPMGTPSNDAVRESLKTGIATGTVPPLATYTPGGPQNAGQPDGRPRPYSAPPVAEAPPPVEEQAPAPMQPAPARTAGPDRKVMAQMVAILRNPWVPEADKAMVRQRHEDMLKKSDPDYIYEQQVKRQKDELEIGKSKIELHNLQNPDRPMQAWTDPNNGDLYAYEPHDPVGTKVLVQKAAPKAGEDDYKVIPKGSRVMHNGKLVDFGEGTVAPEVDVENAIKLQKNFEGQPSMSSLQAIAPTLKSMYRSIGDPSAMADLNFIYGLAKILDPTSVVRESEAGMVIDSQGIAPQLLGRLNKMLSGEQAMDKTTRMNLYKVAASRAEEMRNAAIEERSFAAQQLRSIGAPEDDYLRQVPSVPRDQDMRQPFGSQSVAATPQRRAPAPNVERYDAEGNRIQ